MRALIVLAGAALGLAACGKNGEADQTANASDMLTPENIIANDVTAIDAVTGDAANMAADVDINFTNQQITANSNRLADRPSARRESSAARPSSSPANTVESAPEPAGNVTANHTE